MTLTELLLARAAEDETGLRLVDRRERARWYPWSEVCRRALGICGSLERLGVAPGDRVALVLPTGIGFFDALFGTLLAGAVPTPLYPPVRLGRLDEYEVRSARMLAAVEARLVLTDRRVGALLEPAVARARPPLGARRIAELRAAPGRPILRGEDELALVQFSSGTTADPRPVALSDRALLAQVERLNALWPDRDGVVHSGVSWLPLYHDMGLIGCVLPALARPGTLTLLPPELFVARPALWLRAISRYRATISPAPNFAYGLCAARVGDEELDGVDLSSWRVAINGAEAVSASSLRAFARRFARWGLHEEALTPVYGLSEAALAVTFSALERPFVSTHFDRRRLCGQGEAVAASDGVELVSLGRPLPDFSLRVVAEDGADLPSDRVGRLLVAGPSLMEGYLGQPKATAATLAEGWLDTGDLGFVHDGELYLVGRAKEVLIVRGRNLAPEVVEGALDRVGGVRTGCAVAVGDRPQGADSDRLVVLVEARRGLAEGLWPDLAAACAEAIVEATGVRPEVVEILAPGTLPRTSSGKRRRREALRRWQRGALVPPTPVRRLRLMLGVLGAGLARAFGERRGGR